MITDLNHITLAVTDLERSFLFYRDVLNLKPIVKWDKGSYFLVGEFWLCLNFDHNRVPSQCYTHYAFTVSQQEFELMSSQITSSGVEIFRENQSPGDSLYFLDPDGHKLEIHVGDWRSRVKAKKHNPGNWQDITWFV